MINTPAPARATGLSTNQGTTWQGVMMLVLALLQGMDAAETWTPKTILISLTLIVIAVINFRTVGSGLTPDEAESLQETTERLHDGLKRGRR